MPTNIGGMIDIETHSFTHSNICSKQHYPWVPKQLDERLGERQGSHTILKMSPHRLLIKNKGKGGRGTLTMEKPSKYHPNPMIYHH